MKKETEEQLTGLSSSGNFNSELLKKLEQKIKEYNLDRFCNLFLVPTTEKDSISMEIRFRRAEIVLEFNLSRLEEADWYVFNEDKSQELEDRELDLSKSRWWEWISDRLDYYNRTRNK